MEKSWTLDPPRNLYRAKFLRGIESKIKNVPTFVRSLIKISNEGEDRVRNGSWQLEDRVYLVNIARRRTDSSDWPR